MKKNIKGITPLMIAIMQKHTDVIKALLPISNVNAQTADGQTALSLAIEQGDANIVELLENAGAKLSASKPNRQHTYFFTTPPKEDATTALEFTKVREPS